MLAFKRASADCSVSANLRFAKAHRAQEREFLELAWSITGRSKVRISHSKIDKLACQARSVEILTLASKSLMLHQIKTAILIQRVAVFIFLWYNDFGKAVTG